MQTSEQALAVLDKAAEEGCALARSAQKSFSAVLQIARVVNTIRTALDPKLVRELIMPLKNVDFGWRQDTGSYTEEQIRDCFVSATLQGAYPINNEVNIISGRHYLTLNYFRRVVGCFPGLTDLIVTPGKVLAQQGGATVEMVVTWKLNGKDQKLERLGASAIPVRLNAGMGADGAIGKATRKVLKAVYERLTGSQSFADGDVDDGVGEVTVSAQIVPDAEVQKSESKVSKSAQVADVLKKQANVKTPQQKAEESVQSGDESPWEAPADTQEHPQAEAQSVEQSVAAVVAAVTGTTESAPAEAPKAKKKGGFVRDGGTGDFKRLDGTATVADIAKTGPTVVVPKSGPPAEPASNQDEDLESNTASETRQDIFVEKIVRIKDPSGTVLYYKTPLKESTDIFCVLDEKSATDIRDVWIPKGKNGEMCLITYVPDNIGGQDVCVVQKVEAVA